MRCTSKLLSIRIVRAESQTKKSIKTCLWAFKSQENKQLIFFSLYIALRMRYDDRNLQHQLRSLFKAPALRTKVSKASPIKNYRPQTKVPQSHVTIKKRWIHIVENATAILLSSLAVYCSALHYTLILPVYVVLLLSARSYVISIFSLPLAYIALFHPGILLDLYELLSGEGALRDKLALIKIAFVHTTPVSYWIELTTELVLLYTLSLSICYILKKQNRV